MTQVQRVLKWLDDFGSITTMEAYTELGITRLASRIHEIIGSGVDIHKETVSGKNRYGEKVSYTRYSRG